MPRKKRRVRTTPYVVPTIKSESWSCLSCGELNIGSRVTCSACDFSFKRTNRKTFQSKNKRQEIKPVSDNQTMDASNDSRKSSTSSEGSTTPISTQTTPTQSPPTHTSHDPSGDKINPEARESAEGQGTLTSKDTTIVPSVEKRLPDFMSALNMRPSILPETRQSNSDDSVAMDTGQKPDSSSLIEKYRKDPSGVLGLLKSALSTDKLSELLSNEHNSKTEELKQLQTKLEGAYETLKSCTEHKDSLTKNIDHTSELIKSKRKHLEGLRDELKLLGEEEAALKRRRDGAHSTHAQLSSKLEASKEALKQITMLEKTEPGGSNH